MADRPEEQMIKKRARAKEYHHTVRKFDKDYIEKKKKYYRNNKERFRLTVKKCVLQREFGLSWEEFQEMYEGQNGLCAICNKPEENRMLSVDHCHVTGRVRGLLCGNCNRGLGLFKDNKELLLRAAEYL